MYLEHFQPHYQLRGYISKLWAFESSGRAPSEDMKLIVPNGMAKMTIPYRNGVSGKNKDGFRMVKEGSVTIIGIGDTPTIVDLEHDAPHGNIGIEFSPSGAYRLFPVRQADLKNRIFLIDEVLGKPARRLQEEIANAESVHEKIQVVQRYFIQVLSASEPDRVLDYCISEIEGSKGLVTVGELARKTGFSSRWLYEKFMEKVGLSPKNLTSVIRFMQFYGQWAKDPGRNHIQEDVYRYFYDQAHFIKEFKRFTGLSPQKFVRSENEFGRIFYRE